MVLKDFKKFTKKHNIMYTVVVDLHKAEKYGFGKKKKLMDDSLYNSLFGDEYNITRLEAFLRDQRPPQSWEQGNLNCLVVKPDDNVIVGLFYDDKPDPVDSYRHAKLLNNEVIDLWRIR